MTRQEAFRLCQQVLAEAGVADAAREARYLLKAVLAMDGPAFFRSDEEALTAQDMLTMQDWLARRAAGVPLSRLRGMREFWGMDFILNEATLDPRPDSETLIEAVRARKPDGRCALRILDLGTGTGCLLLALLKEYPAATGLGIDTAARALEAAGFNAQAHGLGARAGFVHSHWCEKVEGFFDVIISNPPYIAEEERRQLEKNVLDHDPVLALFAGPDGLDAYRTIIPQARKHLKTGGLLALEIGATQREAVTALLQKEGYEDIIAHKDLAGHDRVVTAYSKTSGA